MATALPSPARLGARTGLPVLVITSVAAFMAFLDATIVNIAFPSIEQSFPGEPLSTLSWVLNGYNVILAAFLAVTGTVADAFGRRRVFALGVIGFTVFSGLCALAPTAGWLVAMRVGQAMGAALLIPASMALLLRAVQPERRASSVALYAATASVAAGIGPSLGGLLIEASDWRTVFLVNLPIGAALVFATYRFVPESRGQRLRPDVLGGALLATAIGSLALGVVKAPEWGWTSTRVLACAAVTVLAGALVVRRSARRIAPVLDLPLLRVRRTASANVATLLFATGFFCANLGGVLFLTTVWGYSMVTAGLAVSPSPLISAVVAVPSGRIADRYGQAVLAIPGALLFGAGITYLALRTSSTPDYVRDYLPATLIFGTGVGLAFPALTSAAVIGVPDRKFAAASATNAVVRQLGAVLGVSILVAVIGTPQPGELVSLFHHAWLVAAAVASSSAIAVVVMQRAGRAA